MVPDCSHAILTVKLILKVFFSDINKIIHRICKNTYIDPREYK